MHDAPHESGDFTVRGFPARERVGMKTQDDDQDREDDDADNDHDLRSWCATAAATSSSLPEVLSSKALAP